MKSCMTTQTTPKCMLVDHSDQLQLSSQTSQPQAQEMMSSHALKPANCMICCVHELALLEHGSSQLDKINISYF